MSYDATGNCAESTAGCRWCVTCALVQKLLENVPCLEVHFCVQSQSFCFVPRTSGRGLSVRRGRQMSQNGNFTTTQAGGGHRSNACCLCWCCCCSNSWREDEDRNRRISHNITMETLENCDLNAKPTAEEIHLWAQSFDKLLKTPAGRNSFREFLRTEYSEENMLFWLACEDFKTCWRKG
ncbi:regulator of G-protein signaling 20-like [Amblyraja radiata]|uniref:regulator of G-protein signaling 20-like n=1 Tax=Amblyraja radiata TaxID=386614 RepID=UPI0014033009|nr:regulator of G-protein signaling 20-like [Amblyraja radiata]